MKIYFQVVMLLGMVDKKLYNGTEVLSLNLNSIINLLINVINGSSLLSYSLTEFVIPEFNFSSFTLKSPFWSHLYGENLSQVERSFVHLRYSRREPTYNFPLTRPNLSNRLHRRVTHLAKQTFLHVNTLARPAGPTRSRGGNHSKK